MKKVLLMLVALSAVVLVAGQAMAAISGSSHDLRTPLSITEICVPCHVPHNAESTQGPLWNRAANTSTVFTDAGDASNACLSCHDGNTNMDAYGGVAPGSTAITGTGLLDTAAGNHPVGQSYAGAGFNNPPLNGVPDITGDTVECASCHDPHDTTNAPFLVVSNSGSAICLGCHIK